MSLKTKLILLFLGLAITPLLVLAGFSYWQAQDLVRETVQDQLMEWAELVGRGLEERRSEVRQSLAALVASPDRIDRLSEGGGLLAREAVNDQTLARAVYFSFHHPSEGDVLLAGSFPDEDVTCSGMSGSRILEFHVDAERRGIRGELRLGIWARDLIDRQVEPRSGEVLLIDAGSGRTLFSDDCRHLLSPRDGDPPPWWSSFPSGQGSRGRYVFQEERERVLAAFARVPDSDWVVVATSDPGVALSPLNRMVVAYWAFVLVLALTTVIAFSMLIGKFTKSLQELALAAEEIGTGELDPWLPLPTSGEVGQLTLAFSRMLSRIRQMMTKVDQSGRLAVVGQLSAYLAHEIRNPLSSIKLNLQRLQRWTRNGSLPEFCLDPVEISLKEVDRLSASVSGVLELSSASETPLEAVGLHGVVLEAVGLLEARFRRQGVELELDLDAGADRVLGRVGQIKSIVLNLMVNALEAQPDGGRLKIRSELTSASETGGPVIALHFKDDGDGVSSELRDRIFEPFFSTKAGGAGIGLAMVSQAVRECGGDLYLEPAFMPDAGAEFVVVIPLAPVEDVVTGKVELDLPTWTAIPARWRRAGGNPGQSSGPGAGIPSHLLSPEGLEAVLSRLKDGNEEVK